jgi:ribokinase
VVLVFGSINIDFVTRVEKFPGPGESVSGISFASYPGGKGANQALACTLAGARTRLVGAVGRDAFADPALSLLGKAGVELTSVTRVDQATGCATILVAGSGENMIVSVPGANAAADPDSIPDALLNASSTVSLQHELPAAANQALVERARRNGSRVVLNASPWRPLSLDTLCTVDYLVVNEREAAALAAAFDWPRSTRELALAAAAAVHDLTIVVTLGKQGALAARGSELLRIQAPDISVIDTTGAGDAFAGTLIAALDSYAKLDEALRRGVAAGSLACTVAGAQPSFPDCKAVDVALERIALLTARCS